MNRVLVLSCVTTLCSIGALPLAAQITLGDAFRAADRSAYGNRIAAGTADVQGGHALAPLRGILPTLRVEAGYVRTTDPIGVFGATLRQRTVSQANFDPQRLNFAGAIGNYQSGLAGQASSC